MKVRITLLIAAAAAFATIISSATPASTQRVRRNIDDCRMVYCELNTAGEAATLILAADRTELSADGQGVSFVDAAGVVAPVSGRGTARGSDRPGRPGRSIE